MNEISMQAEIQNISSWIMDYCSLMITDSPNRGLFTSKILI